MTDALVVFAGGLLGGFVSGLAGFGLALTAIGVWLHVAPPAIVAPLVVCCSCVAQSQTLPSIWRSINWRRIWPMLAAGNELAEISIVQRRLAIGLPGREVDGGERERRRMRQPPVVGKKRFGFRQVAAIAHCCDDHGQRRVRDRPRTRRLQRQAMHFRGDAS